MAIAVETSAETAKNTRSHNTEYYISNTTLRHTTHITGYGQNIISVHRNAVSRQAWPRMAVAASIS